MGLVLRQIHATSIASHREGGSHEAPRVTLLSLVHFLAGESFNTCSAIFSSSREVTKVGERGVLNSEGVKKGNEAKGRGGDCG